MKLHLGSGRINFGKGWLHIDEFPYKHVRVEPVYPLKYKNVSIIYASHVLTYFEREKVSVVLLNWYNALKKGGVLRLAVPNFRVLSALYTRGDLELYEILPPLFGRIENGMGGYIYHKTTYDEAELVTLLFCAGFKKVVRWDWKKIAVHKKHFDCSRSERGGISVSLNVEAIK